MKRALIIGRFQPPHNGHLYALERAARRADEVIVAVGSAQEAYTIENPLTAGERLEMLSEALKERKIANAWLVPVVDIQRHPQWVSYIEGLVPAFDEVVTNNPLTKLLFARAGYKVRTEALYERKTCRGVRIRSQLAHGFSVADVVPKSVERLLRRFRVSQRIRSLAQRDLDAVSAKRPANA